MTPRPPTPIGHYGAISVKRLETTGTWHARARYRGTDGRSREVTARGQTKQQAINRLKARIADMAQLGAEGMTPDTRMRELLAWWVEHHDRLSERSRAEYTKTIERHLIPRCGDVRIREVTTAMVDRVVADILEKRVLMRNVDGRQVRTEHGGQFAAEHARVILRQALDEAVRLDIIQTSPGAAARALSRGRRTVDVLNAEQLGRLRRSVRAHYEASTRRWAGRYTPDIVDMLVGTGARIGEVIAAQWGDLDLEAGTWEISGTIDKHGGHYDRKDSPKTEASRRVLQLPSWLVATLQRRRDALGAEPEPRDFIMLTYRGYLVSTTSIGSAIRAGADEDLQHVTPHMIRRSVATIIERASGAAVAAQQLGHRDEGVTRKHYIAKRAVFDSSAVLDALDEGPG